MSKKLYALVGLLVVIGVAVSLMLIPDTKELALIEYKDKIYDKDKDAYSAKDKYIEQLQQGNLSIDVVSALVDIYLQEGNVNEAINVLEAYLAKNPNDVQARQKLGTLYQYAQRPDDYLRNLEEINKLTSNKDTLRALSDIYHFNQQYDKQTDALQSLLKNKDKISPEKYTELANLLATDKKPQDAIIALRALQKDYPDYFSFEDMQLLVSLLMDVGDQNGAYLEAVNWRDTKQKPLEVARLVNVLHFRGAPQLAQKLIDPYQQELSKYPPLLIEQVLLDITFGKEDEAYAMMKDLYSKDQLPLELTDSFLMIALKKNDDAMVKELSALITPANTSESEAIALTELAVATRRTELLQLINEKLGTPDYLNTYPLFGIVLSLANQTADADDKIAAYVAQGNVGEQQQLVIARNCARAGKATCANKFLDELKKAPEMTNQRLAAIGSIYLEMKQYEDGYVFLEQHLKEEGDAEVEKIWARLAAGAGHSEQVKEWVAAHENYLDRQLMNDLYFLAADNRQDALALDMAKMLQQREDSAQTREYLANAYIRTGQYHEAIDLLSKDGNLSGPAVDTVFAALTAQAKRDPKYKADLAQFAREQLESNTLDSRRKMGMLYALIDMGRFDVAGPYIKRLALTQGGQWASLYAENLDKQGKYEEARQFWLLVANQKNTRPETKRNIAFTLLERGYRDDALALFGELAENQGPTGPDVRQLIYLWGPRVDDSQANWLYNRSATAASEQEKNEWLKLIADYTGDDAVVQIAESKPESLQQADMLTRYLAVKSASGDNATIAATFAPIVENSNDPNLLRQVARYTRDTGNSELSIRAYNKLRTLEPQDEESLREVGIIAQNNADYSEAKTYLGNYLQARQNSSKPDPDAYKAYFTYAELMRREKETEESRKYYKATIDLINAENVRTADMESKYAQSLVGMGQKKQGYASFQQAMTKHPADDILRADYASTLIENKDYKTAWKVTERPTGTISEAALQQPMQLSQGDYRGYKLNNDRTELLLVFDPALTGQSRIKPEQSVNYDWVNFVTEGYDRTLVSAKPGYKMEIVRGDGNNVIIVPQKEVADASKSLEAQTHLRYELLRARIELETGDQNLAVERLQKLSEKYPNDAQLMGFTANAENFSGRWPRALKLLRQAEAIQPQNEDIAILKRDIEMLHAEHVKLDHEWRMLGDNNEQITTLEAIKSISDGWDVGAVVMNDFVDSDNVRRADGRIGEFSEDRQQGELFATYTQDNGTQYKGSVFANNDTLGLGGYVTFITDLGQTIVGAEYHRPYWEFVEGVLDDATRDRIGVNHTARLSEKLTVSGGTGVNRYNVDIEDDVASSVGVNVNVAYQIQEEPTMAIVYGFDGEYDSSHETKVDAAGVSYRPFPFRTREIHSLGLAGTYEFSRETRAEYLVGYSYDRFGGNGPVGELRVTHDINEDLQAQGRAYYGLGAGNTDDDLARVGAYIMYRY